VSEFLPRGKNSISRGLTQHLRKTFPPLARSLHSSEWQWRSIAYWSRCVSNLNPRQRGQQFTLTLARPKAISKISYQRLKGGWLETNFLIVSAVQENEVAFLEADPKERD
jgi:hypothetical protein